MTDGLPPRTFTVDVVRAGSNASASTKCPLARSSSLKRR